MTYINKFCLKLFTLKFKSTESINNLTYFNKKNFLSNLLPFLFTKNYLKKTTKFNLFNA